MTTKKRPRRAQRFTEAQCVAIREAYEALCNVNRVLATQLRKEFGAVFGDDLGALFSGLPNVEEDAAPEGDYQEPTGKVSLYEFRGVLEWYHPRVQAALVCVDAPSRPLFIAHDVAWQLACLRERWGFRIGEMDFGRFARSMKPAQERYDFESLWNGIEAFRELKQAHEANGRVVPVQRFWDALPTYIEWGRMPYRNDVGDLTKRGRAVFGEQR